MFASALITQPAGQADVQVEIEIAVERLALTGETVHDGVTDIVAPVLEHLEHLATGVTFMQKQRQACLGGQRQLRFERSGLFGGGREVAIEVEATFPHRDDLWLRQ